MRGCDLIAHERQQRGDHDGRPPASVAKDAREGEVHARLAETGTGDEQRAAAFDGHSGDRGQLFRSGNCIGAGKCLDVSGEFGLGPEPAERDLAGGWAISEVASLRGVSLGGVSFGIVVTLTRWSDNEPLCRGQTRPDPTQSCDRRDRVDRFEVPTPAANSGPNAGS